MTHRDQSEYSSVIQLGRNLEKKPNFGKKNEEPKLKNEKTNKRTIKRYVKVSPPEFDEHFVPISLLQIGGVLEIKINPIVRDFEVNGPNL